MNKGKIFESDFQKSVPYHWFIYRLKDSAVNWNRTDLTQHTPSNSCDFFLFTGSTLYGVECKSFKGKSMPFSKIKEKQLKDLLAMSVNKPLNAQGLFILNFRDLSETFSINAFMLNALIQQGHRKSIGIDEARHIGARIPQQLKRVRYRYDLTAIGL